MGGVEARPLGRAEPLVKYHPYCIRVLTFPREAGEGTVPGGQFDWGGFLLKSNGGAQRFSQCGWQSHDECKGIRELNCESDKTSRCESRS